MSKETDAAEDRPLQKALPYDPFLRSLWSDSLEQSLAAANELYESISHLNDEKQRLLEEELSKLEATLRRKEQVDWQRTGRSEAEMPIRPPHNNPVAEALSAEFLRVLKSKFPDMPATPPKRYVAVAWAVGVVLSARIKAKADPFIEDAIAAALRPIRKLQAGILTGEVCAALYDYERGVWAPHLTKPQLYVIRTALAKTIASLPPDEMDVFWENLQSADGMTRRAMLLGLESLRSAHSVPHLLRGLETSRDHDVRAAIVDCLEQIADPRAIAVMQRLHRETARTDWTLSRHIQRAMRVIEHQNRGQAHRQLLRPTQTPPDDDRSLVRPAADPEDRPDAENTTLLRSTEGKTTPEEQ